MPRDPVRIPHERAIGPLREWLSAAMSYLDIGRPSFAEVQALWVVALNAWDDEVIHEAAKLPDEGSGQR